MILDTVAKNCIVNDRLLSWMMQGQLDCLILLLLLLLLLLLDIRIEILGKGCVQWSLDRHCRRLGNEERV
jgi:hypothetical protein